MADVKLAPLALVILSFVLQRSGPTFAVMASCVMTRPLFPRFLQKTAINSISNIETGV